LAVQGGTATSHATRYGIATAAAAAAAVPRCACKLGKLTEVTDVMLGSAL
jgi:hypothetical protein